MGFSKYSIFLFGNKKHVNFMGLGFFGWFGFLFEHV